MGGNAHRTSRFFGLAVERMDGQLDGAASGRHHSFRENRRKMLALLAALRAKVMG